MASESHSKKPRRGSAGGGPRAGGEYGGAAGASGEPGGQAGGAARRSSVSVRSSSPGRSSVPSKSSASGNVGGRAVRRPGRTLLAAAALAALAVAAFWPALAGGYLWDDDGYISEVAFKPTTRLIHAADGLGDIWLSRKAMDYWPLTNTAFWIQWRLWGTDPAGYHAVNLLLHALGAVLVWRVLAGLHVPWAWLCAALFAVHPVAAASVAWVSELKNCLSLPLYAAAVLAWLRWQEGGRGRWYAVALAAFALALAAKTSGIGLPIVLLLLAWWRGGRIDRRTALGSVPFFALAAAMGALTMAFQYTHTFAADQAVRPEGAASRVAAAGWVAWFYAIKSLVPVGLAMQYPRWHVDAASVSAWLPLAALAVLAAAAWRWRASWGRPLLAAMGAVLALLGPVLGLTAISFHRISLVSDHLQYLALPVVMAAAALLGRLSRRGRWKFTAIGVGAALVAAGAALSWQRAHVFRSPESLWRDTLAKNPRAFVGHNNLGTVLLDRGQAEEALAHFQEAVRIKENYAEAHSNWGNALLRMGRPEEALPHYRRALELKAWFPEVHNNWAAALLDLKRFPEAAEHCRQAVEMLPIYALAQNNWGRALQGLHRPQEALEHFRRAVEIDPGFAEAVNNAGAALQDLGRYEEALGCYRWALRLRPGFTQAQNNAAWLLATSPVAADRDGRQAVELARRAAEATGRKIAGVLDTLAAAYAEAGEFSEAVRCAERAVELAAEKEKAAFLGRLELYRAGKPYRLTKPQ